MRGEAVMRFSRLVHNIPLPRDLNEAAKRLLFFVFNSCILSFNTYSSTFK